MLSYIMEKIGISSNITKLIRTRCQSGASKVVQDYIQNRENTTVDFDGHVMQRQRFSADAVASELASFQAYLYKFIDEEIIALTPKALPAQSSRSRPSGVGVRTSLLSPVSSEAGDV
jgi:hypothetical protein